LRGPVESGLDETFDVGCDKGSRVSPDYAPLTEFTGRIIKIEFDLSPTSIMTRTPRPKPR
jgi:hypothetical protein